MAEQPLSSDHEAASVLSVPAQRAPPDMPRARRWPWSGITLVRLAVLITAGVIVVLFATQWDRWVGLAVRQVTDDAYVRGDITPLSAQVEGYVRRVPVDDFQRVKQGELLVQIEDDDYRARVAQAEADLLAAKAGARGIEAEARSRRWKLQRAVEDLENQIALLHARVAALDKSKAVLTLAQIDFSRAKQLLGTPAESRQQYDRAQRALSTADAQVNEALAQVYQARASLGLPAQPGSGEDLAQVPPDLDETFSSVLEAQADLIQSAARLGVIHSYAQSPKQMLDEFAKQGEIDRYFAQLTTKAPAVKQAEAKLDLAKINLGYTRLTAPAGGEVSERDVRPGQYVHAGSQVITVVPDNVWVVANYKETQLTHVAIGQRAEIRVDTFPGISIDAIVDSIAPASGAQFSLLPPDNSTGNFTKVVQRIPVKLRIAPDNPLAGKLRPGMSVVATILTDTTPPPP
ncbi:MAG TPA: HlyD family secretion protein [Bradyrhizobium sp.]|nr:HlyD family secretion protein [Bradyrhizobium sp.]